VLNRTELIEIPYLSAGHYKYIQGKVELFLLLNPTCIRNLLNNYVKRVVWCTEPAISSDVTIVIAAELPRSRTKLMVEAWVAANHDSVRLCRPDREGEMEVSLTQLAAPCLNDFYSHFKTYRYE